MSKINFKNLCKFSKSWSLPKMSSLHWSTQKCQRGQNSENSMHYFQLELKILEKKNHCIQKLQGQRLHHCLQNPNIKNFY